MANLNAEIQGKYAVEGYVLLEEYEVQVTKWRADVTGCAYLVTPRQPLRRIEGPHPKSVKSWLVLAHEVAHHVLGHCDRKGGKRYIEEYQAWIWALQEAPLHGIEVSEEVVDWVREFVRYSLEKALRRKLKTWSVPEEIIRFVSGGPRLEIP